MQDHAEDSNLSGTKSKLSVIKSRMSVSNTSLVSTQFLQNLSMLFPRPVTLHMPS